MSISSRPMTFAVTLCSLLWCLSLAGCNGAPAEQDTDGQAEATNQSAEPSPDRPRAGTGPLAEDRPEENPDLADGVFQAIVDEDEALAIDLLENGAPPNARNEREVTVLHFAVRASMLDLTRRLLEFGADPNATLPENGQSVIHWASRIGANDRPHSVEILDLLLEYGAEINHADMSGIRPVDYGVHLDNVEWVQIMVERGARLN